MMLIQKRDHRVNKQTVQSVETIVAQLFLGPR
jgi:hypothetical protein